MLGTRNYEQDYVNDCRAKVKLDVRAYDELFIAARAEAGTDFPAAELKDYEQRFFNNLILLLDYFFVHRLRTVEGKDGNPLNEVRVICDSILHNGGRMRADKSIKDSARTVLGKRVGDEIRLTREDFLRIAERFFAEVERRYV